MVQSSGVESLQCLFPRKSDFIAPFCLVCKQVLLSYLWIVDSNTGEWLSIDMRQLFLYLCRRVTCNTGATCCFPWCCSFSDSDFSSIFFGVSVSVHESHSDCVFTFKFIIVIIVIDIFYYYICIMYYVCYL